MTALTPGPWYIGKQAYERGIRGADGKKVAEVSLAYKDSATYHANARLIAAAPETAAERDRLAETNVALIAALEEINNFIGGRHQKYAGDWEIYQTILGNVKKIARRAIKAHAPPVGQSPEGVGG